MIIENTKFNELQKFLSLDLSLDDYQDWQDESDIIDSELGFCVYSIEDNLIEKAKKISKDGNVKSWGKLLHKGSQSWVGLNPKQLQTTYREFFDILNFLPPSDKTTFCDLGAGYGRFGLVLNLMNNKSKFIGFEISKARVDEGNRIFNKYNCLNSKLICQDLVDPSFFIPESDVYFIYDYGLETHIKHTLEQISTIADTKKIAIIARGRGVRSIIHYKHPWLTVVEPIETDSYAIYRN